MKFVDVLAEHGVEFIYDGDKHCRPGWVQLKCPFCRSGKFHLGYNLSKGYLSCYKCGFHNPTETLVAATDMPWKQAKALLGDLEHDRQEVAAVKRGKLAVPDGVKDMTRAHRDYLRERGFNPEEIAGLWKVQGIGLSSRLSWRIYIPIQHEGETVSWTARSIKENAEQRYVSASEEEEAIPHKTLLYGEDNCRHAICAVEGPISSWAIGYGGAATCGTAITRAQIMRLARYPMRGICFDAEPIAQRRARKLCDELSVFPGQTINFVLDVKDPAEELRLNRGRDLLKIRRTLGL